MTDHKVTKGKKAKKTGVQPGVSSLIAEPGTPSLEDAAKSVVTAAEKASAEASAANEVPDESAKTQTTE